VSPNSKGMSATHSSKEKTSNSRKSRYLRQTTMMTLKSDQNQESASRLLMIS